MKAMNFYTANGWAGSNYEQVKYKGNRRKG